MAVEPYPIKECIYDPGGKRLYIYRKVKYSNGVVRYYYKGRNIHARNEKKNRKANIVNFDKNDPKLLMSYYFPDWFEVGVDKKTYQTDYYGKMIEGPEESVENKNYSFHKWNKRSLVGLKTITKWVCEDIEPPITSIITEGTVVDFETNEPLNGAKVKYKKDNVTTHPTGIFKIRIDVPKNQLEAKTNQLFISKEGYVLGFKSPYKGDGSIKTSLGIIPLKPIKKLKFPQISLDIPDIEILTLPEKDFKFFSKQQMIRILDEVLKRLLPIIQAMLLEFGMKLLNDKFEEMKDQVSCPPKEKLDKLVDKKNKLVKQLNNLMKTIDNSLKVLGFTEGILIMTQVGVQSINAIPYPMPPSIPFAAQKGERGIEALNSIVTTSTSLLTILKSVLNQVLTPLNQLDQLIQQCYPDADQTQLSKELQLLTQEEQSPIITIVNGFTMDVEQEITEKPLKRRRSIAKDTSGVTVLKGEWSFSSIDQILIDELVFYIQTNNLKAN
jgi:hypothetical protein